jgi:hypothetical protein
MINRQLPRALLLISLLAGGFASSLQAAPHIQAIDVLQTQHDIFVITGTDFNQFDGEIVSWDDFESQTAGTKLKGTKPIVGANWSTIYNYDGMGITVDSTDSISGNNSVKVDWSIDPESIRAFGWANRGPYSQLYISYWRKMTGDFVAATSNHKQFYLYGNVDQFPQGMPMMPGGTDRWGFYNNVSEGRITAENPNPNNINDRGWKWSNTNGVFQRWEFFIKLNEPSGMSNGVIQMWLDGQKGVDRNNYRIRNVDGEFIDFRLGHMAQGFYSTAKAWFDDLYIATTPARIEICNSNDYELCTIKHIQFVEPSNWSPTKIMVKLRGMPAFKEETSYLYVIDKFGTASNPIKVPKPTWEQF